MPTPSVQLTWPQSRESPGRAQGWAFSREQCPAERQLPEGRPGASWGRKTQSMGPDAWPRGTGMRMDPGLGRAMRGGEGVCSQGTVWPGDPVSSPENARAHRGSVSSVCPLCLLYSEGRSLGVPAELSLWQDCVRWYRALPVATVHGLGPGGTGQPAAWVCRTRRGPARGTQGLGVDGLTAAGAWRPFLGTKAKFQVLAPPLVWQGGQAANCASRSAVAGPGWGRGRGAQCPPHGRS